MRWCIANRPPRRTLAGPQVLHSLVEAEQVEEGAQRPDAFAFRLPVGGPAPMCDARMSLRITQ